MTAFVPDTDGVLRYKPYNPTPVRSAVFPHLDVAE